MTTELRIICDRCGAEIDPKEEHAEHIFFRPQRDRGRLLFGQMTGDWQHDAASLASPIADLCGSCMKYVGSVATEHKRKESP